MKTLILIPTFNAEKDLLDVLSDIYVNVPDADVLVIDHGSTDRTVQLLKNNNVNHLTMPLLTTYYHALSLGMIYAHKNKYDVVIEWDDKGKFNPADIKYFTSIIERKKVDMVLGSRFINERPPHKMRWLGTRTLKGAIKLATGKKITDPTFRFRAYGKKAIKAFKENDFLGPAPDSVARFIKDGLTFSESYTVIQKGYKRQLHLGIGSSSREIFRWTMWILFILTFRRKNMKGSKNE